MTDFSSWGPTDDGRIKPDLVGNGADLYSSVATTDTAYDTYSGTSMATPNVTGSSILLINLYDKLFPRHAMRASTLKALLIGTADDLGTPGPDYQNGWGLINVKAAADLLNTYKAKPGSRAVVEDRLTSAGDTRSFTFTWDGVSPIRATLAWTDPAGTSTSTGESRVARLVNNLDLKITAPSGTVHQPWVMPYTLDWSAASLSAAAVTGHNVTDNVEQVYVAAPVAGVYTATVSCDGALTNSTQIFSLIISGGSGTLSAPAISLVSPAVGSAGGTGAVTVTGSGFAAGAAVTFVKSGQTEVAGESLEPLGDTLKFRPNTTGMAAGAWDVRVTNPDGQSATLPAAYNVAGALWTETFESGGAGWVESASTGTSSLWGLSSASSHSATHAIAAAVPVVQNVADLYSPAITIPTGATGLRVSFWQSYRFTSTRFGGVLELSSDDGVTWVDAASASSGASFTSGGYTGTLSSTGTTATKNPLAGRSAWTGTVSTFTQSILDITSPQLYAGKNLRLRWRLATGTVNTVSTGTWYVDDVVLSGIAPAVTTPVSNFASWWSSRFGAGVTADPLGDPDGDGISNLLEYALGMDPLAPGLMPAPELTDGMLSITFERPKTPADITWAAEISDDLQTWTEIPLEVISSGETETMRAADTNPPPDTGRRFMRLKVSVAGE